MAVGDAGGAEERREFAVRVQIAGAQGDRALAVAHQAAGRGPD